jgi:hypothetical protein
MVDRAAVCSALGGRRAEWAADAGQSPCWWQGRARGQRPVKAMRAIQGRRAVRSTIWRGPEPSVPHHKPTPQSRSYATHLERASDFAVQARRGVGASASCVARRLSRQGSPRYLARASMTSSANATPLTRADGWDRLRLNSVPVFLCTCSPARALRARASRTATRLRVHPTPGGPGPPPARARRARASHTPERVDVDRGPAAPRPPREPPPPGFGDRGGRSLPAA